MKESKSFPADLANLGQILSWVRTQLSSASLDKGERMRVELAMEEAIVNVINHTPLGDEFELSLHCKLEPERQLEFILKDPGPPYNPLVKEPVENDNLSLEEIEEGGAGLKLIRQCMDALFYRRDEDHNVLTLIKKLTASRK